MKLDIKGQKCAVCTSYLFEDDDIVYCPVCGAPHHRDCYNAVGKCGLEQFHGTEAQYKKPVAEKTDNSPAQPPMTEREGPARKCRMCGEELSGSDRFCPQCGFSADGQSASPFVPFSPVVKTAEINDNTEIAEGVTALEASKIVLSNPFRYIPKFLTLNENKKTSWNWAAFILPGAWFAFRKMYKESIITTVLMIMTLLFNIPFNLAILQLPAAESTVNTALELGSYYAQYIDQIGTLPVILALAGMVISVVIRIVCAVYGDWIYKNRVIYAAEKIRNCEDEEQARKKYSGTSFIGFALAVLAMEFLPSIIAAFIV